MVASGRFVEASAMTNTHPTHSKAIGYLLWIFGFTGSHRFYFGRPISGTIWFFTLGLLGVGWLIDLFLIPGMSRKAGEKYAPGPCDYSVAWLLQTFIGPLGIHRFYMGKIWTGLLWLFTGGLFLIGYLYDYLTLNGQLDERNRGEGPKRHDAGLARSGGGA
jgi:TM2 domain-containing membrane protein YozV